MLTDQSGNREAGEAFDLREFNILNLSLQSGRGSHEPNRYWLHSFNHPHTQDSASGTLIVKAAGNAGRFAELDMVNNALMQSQYRNSTLIVGAIRAEAQPFLLSDSNAAGEYAENFVVDVGRAVIPGRIKAVEGTSFAAPRVAGKAALLMHKFGGLHAEDYANIIKLTADCLTVEGTPCPSGTPPNKTYGYGRANLTRMLSPVGNLR